LIVDHSEFIKVEKAWKADNHGQRFGQFLYNHFSQKPENKPAGPWRELFYEEKEGKARCIFIGGVNMKY
jgi:hypothetical protein